jgi:hypothetical protein
MRLRLGPAKHAPFRTEVVEREVREHMEILKPGGRWVAGGSHSMVNFIPHENFVTMISSLS